MSALSVDLRPTEIPLDEIYLDPNNPRFTEHSWSYVSDDEADNAEIQQRCREILVKDYDIQKLIGNMEENGFLPIDRVVVRQIAANKYIVLEGNRRICAAKLINRFSSAGIEIEKNTLETFEKIPCLVYTGSERNAAWIFQGIRHISGIVDWSSFNKAKMLVEEMQSQGLSLSQVGKRFGLSAFSAGQWIRGYKSFDQAKRDSDYSSKVKEAHYIFFQELFGKTSSIVRDWMVWDEKEGKFQNVLNFNEFVGWIVGVDDEENEVHSEEKVVITKRDDIRSIAMLLREDKQIFERFRKNLDLEGARAESVAKKYEVQAREEINTHTAIAKQIADCKSAIENIPFRVIRDAESSRVIISEIERFIHVAKEIFPDVRTEIIS